MNKERELRSMIMWACLVLPVGAPVAVCAASLQFVPMSIVLDSEPRRTSLTIVNTGSETVTVQLQMMRWAQDELGRDIYEPTKDLVFYPQIAAIEAGKQAIVRVGYQSVDAPHVEKTYRLFVQELPVAKPGEMAIKVLMRVGIPVFIPPKDAHPIVTMPDARVADGKLLVTIRNSGTSHALVEKIAIRSIDDGGRTVAFRELTGWYVLPGVSRQFPIGLTSEEFSTAARLLISCAAAELKLEGQFILDEQSRAQLAQRAAKEKQQTGTGRPDRQPAPTVTHP